MHSFSDICAIPGIRAAAALAEYWDISYPVARAIVTACCEAYDLGVAGESHDVPLASEAFQALVADAWHDGIVSRKPTIRLETGECSECDNDDDTTCESCLGLNRDTCVTADIADLAYADIWADHDQSIGGSSWETPSDMPHYAYAMPVDHPGLVAELRKEGYQLDLSNYEEWPNTPRHSSTSAIPIACLSGVGVTSPNECQHNHGRHVMKPSK